MESENMKKASWEILRRFFFFIYFLLRAVVPDALDIGVLTIKFNFCLLGRFYAIPARDYAGIYR